MVGIAVVGLILSAVNCIKLIPYLAWSWPLWYAAAFLTALWLGYMLKDARRAVLASIGALTLSATLTYTVYYYPGLVGAVKLLQALEYLAFIEAVKKTLINTLLILLGSIAGALLST